MGKKPGGAGAGAGWLATVRKVLKPSKGLRHAKKQRGGEVEGNVGGGGEAAEIVSVDHHFPTAETSPEVTNECSGAVVWRERDDHEEVARASWRGLRGMATVTAAASSKVARVAAVRGRAGSREERAAMRIQAFYRGYLARRARRALRGLVRLQALVRGHQVRRQVHLTMRCMQALVRAQARVRARRLTSRPHIASRPAARPVQPRPRPGFVDLIVPMHGDGLAPQHGGRRSFGHGRVGALDETELHDHERTTQVQAPQRHSNVSPFLQGTWEAVRDADGVLCRRDTAAAAAALGESAYGFKHQRQLDESEDTEELNAGWHWLERCNAGIQPQQHAPEQPNHQHGPAETSYVTASATDGVSENTVEMEAARKSPTRDLYPVRPPAAIPGYMAATQSARAKARMNPPAAPRPHVRSRSGSVAPGGCSTSTANSGWMSHNGGAGCTSNRAAQQRAGHSPESSCSGDRTPPALGGRTRLAFA